MELNRAGNATFDLPWLSHVCLNALGIHTKFFDLGKDRRGSFILFSTIDCDVRSVPRQVERNGRTNATRSPRHKRSFAF